jgi:autoinducer 2-degrading protein
MGAIGLSIAFGRRQRGILGITVGSSILYTECFRLPWSLPGWNNLKGAAMFIVHVFVRVKPDLVEAFKAASIENARNSVEEPGIGRFDVIQQSDDPSRFILVEAYRTPDDAALHKETAHYKVWRDAVADMMAEPRSSIKFRNLFPDDAGWG